MLKNHRIREAICKAMGPKPRRRKIDLVDLTISATLYSIALLCMAGAGYVAICFVAAMWKASL
jgi:hypothetical protein